jgi:hypothetical protein
MGLGNNRTVGMNVQSRFYNQPVRWLTQIALLIASGCLNAYPPVFALGYLCWLLPALTWSIALLIPALDGLDNKKKTPVVFTISMLVLWHVMAVNAFSIGGFFWAKSVYGGILYVGGVSGLATFLVYNFFITKQFHLWDALVAMGAGIVAFAVTEYAGSSSSPLVAQRSNLFLYWQVCVGVVLYGSYQKRLYRDYKSAKQA